MHSNKCWATRRRKRKRWASNNKQSWHVRMTLFGTPCFVLISCWCESYWFVVLLGFSSGRLHRHCRMIAQVWWLNVVPLAIYLCIWLSFSTLLSTWKSRSMIFPSAIRHSFHGSMLQIHDWKVSRNHHSDLWRCRISRYIECHLRSFSFSCMLVFMHCGCFFFVKKVKTFCILRLSTVIWRLWSGWFNVNQSWCRDELRVTFSKCLYAISHISCFLLCVDFGLTLIALFRLLLTIGSFAMNMRELLFSEKPCYFGESPLGFACCSNQKDIAQFLIDSGADLDFEDSNGNNLLVCSFWSLSCASADVVSLFSCALDLCISILLTESVLSVRVPSNKPMFSPLWP